MQLVDEEDDVAGRNHLVDRVLDPLLEVAAVFRARDHACQVERDKPLLLELGRYIHLDDPPRDSLGDRRLADARLADEAGIVLGAACQDLEHPLDLLLPADHRIDLPLPRHLGEVAAVLVDERGAHRGLGPRRHGATHAQQVRARRLGKVADLLDDRLRFDRELL